MSTIKKVTLGVILAVLFVAFSSLALVFVFRGVKTVNADDALWEYAAEQTPIQDAYLYNEELSVPVKKVTVGGQQATADYTVVYPSGNAYSSEKIVLSETGIYKVRYTAKVGNAELFNEETFLVKADNFVFKNESLGSSAIYGEYRYKDYDYEGEGKTPKTGLKVRLHKNDVLIFNKTIKLSDLDLSTYFVDFFPTPEESGVYECSGVIFKLVDTGNTDNYVEFDVHGNVTFQSGHASAWLTVGAVGQKSYGYEEGKGYHYRDNWGTGISNVSFRAQANFNPAKGMNDWSGNPVFLLPGTGTAKIYFDPITKVATANGSYSNDLDDPAIYGDEIWGGFTSDSVRLEVRTDGAVFDYANFVIMSVLGVELDNRRNAETGEYENPDFVLTDDEPPVVTINTDFDIYEMPLAEIGRKYEIPNATAVDSVFGSCDVTVGVFYNYVSDSPIAINLDGNGFTPELVGEFAVVYSATDSYGNVGKAVLYVEAREELDPIVVTLPAELVAYDGGFADLGRAIALGVPEISGGSGGYSYKISYKFGDGEAVAADKFVLPEEYGTYSIIYTATDYIGKTGERIVTFTGTPSEEVIVRDAVTVDKVYISDIKYTLPVLTGYLYSTSGRTSVYAKVDVTDENGTQTYTSGDYFTPIVENNADTIHIKYYFEGKESTPIYEEDIPVIIGKVYDDDGNVDTGFVEMKNYFFCDGIQASFTDADGKEYSTGIEISATATTERCGWTFGNALVADGIYVEIKGAGDNRLVGGRMQFVVVDAADASKSITANIDFAPTGVTLSYKDESTDFSFGDKSFYESNPYIIRYRANRIYFGTVSVPVYTFDDGTKFTGFPSSLAYLSLYNVVTPSGKKVTAGTKYIVSSVWGSVISVDSKDNAAPSFSLNGDITGARLQNSFFTIPTAICRDVFNPNSDILVSMKDVNGNIVTAEDGTYLNKVPADREYTVRLSVVGTYSLIYTTMELNWNEKNIKDNIIAFYVLDNENPTISLASTPATTAKRGDVIKFADLNVSDNYTPTEDLVIIRAVIASGGKVILLNETNAFVPLYTGNYEFIAMVRDEIGNFALVRYTVTVTE